MFLELETAMAVTLQREAGQIAWELQDVVCQNWLKKLQ